MFSYSVIWRIRGIMFAQTCQDCLSQQRIRPEDDIIIRPSEMPQSVVQAGTNLSNEATAANCFPGLRVTPRVRKRGKARRAVEGCMKQFAGQLVICSSGKKPQEADLAS